MTIDEVAQLSADMGTPGNRCERSSSRPTRFVSTAQRRRRRLITSYREREAAAMMRAICRDYAKDTTTKRLDERGEHESPGGQGGSHFYNRST